LFALLNYEGNTIETVRLALEARKQLFSIAEREGIDFDLKRRGMLHLYHGKSEFAHAVQVNTLLSRGGLDRYAVTPDEIRGIEPTIQGNLYGGLHTPSDTTGDIHKFTIGLAAACQKKGVRFLHDTVVDNIAGSGSGFSVQLTTEGQSHVQDADGVVICAGCESRRLATMVGDRVNVYPVKGYSLTIPLDDETAQSRAPEVGLLDDSVKIVTSRLGAGRFRIAGTAEFDGFNRDIRKDRIDPLVAWVRRYFPDLSTRTAVPWTGLRPMMPNMLPRVASGKMPGLFYNTGHGHLGWTLSAATSELVAGLMVGHFR
jgi:D-amino-acid dehydrogenase